MSDRFQKFIQLGGQFACPECAIRQSQNTSDYMYAADLARNYEQNECKNVGIVLCCRGAK